MSGVKQTRTTWALPQPLRNAQTIPYIPDVDSAARGANLVALQASQQFSDLPTAVSLCRNILYIPLPPLQGSLVRTDLWYEAALLSKLLYKSKNQHRSSKHFQYLSEVCCQYHCTPSSYIKLCLTPHSHHPEHSRTLSQHAVLIRFA